MSLTFNEIKEAMKEREEVETLIQLFGISVEELVDSDCLDILILLEWDRLQKIYEDGGCVEV